MSSLNSTLGQKVSRIVGSPSIDFDMDSATVLLDEFTVVLETDILRVLSIPETDEVHLEVDTLKSVKRGRSLVNIERCRDLVGSTFSELWRSTNSRGYVDQLIFGFKDLHPSIIVLCEGSALKLFRVVRV